MSLFCTVAYLLRNFDGVQGAKLAQALEGCYGLDILTSKGSMAKCAAAQGQGQTGLSVLECA